MLTDFVYLLPYLKIINSFKDVIFAIITQEDIFKSFCKSMIHDLTFMTVYAPFLTLVMPPHSHIPHLH